MHVKRIYNDEIQKVITQTKSLLQERYTYLEDIQDKFNSVLAAHGHPAT